ncbi:hypothetical protein FHL15_007920 [Xylaria flabelliformis]|uniref:Uncharacterized protein n=1 Tax=Xylaria flabelliformis TaxID=2512241 RepID=A0A553HT48_9PEZI|nr:hypothetical protein FHL15_007920 [Xylaria flabelliformis]
MVDDAGFGRRVPFDFDSSAVQVHNEAASSRDDHQNFLARILTELTGYSTLLPSSSSYSNQEDITKFSRHFDSQQQSKCRATSLSGRSRSSPRRRSRTAPFPNGFVSGPETPLGTTRTRTSRVAFVPPLTPPPHLPDSLTFGTCPQTTPQEPLTAITQTDIKPDTTPRDVTGARPVSASRCHISCSAYIDRETLHLPYTLAKEPIDFQTAPPTIVLRRSLTKKRRGVDGWYMRWIVTTRLKRHGNYQFSTWAGGVNDK